MSRDAEFLIDDPREAPDPKPPVESPPIEEPDDTPPMREEPGVEEPGPSKAPAIARAIVT